MEPALSSRFNNLLDQSNAVVANPGFFSVGNHYSLPLDLDVGVFGSIPYELPIEVVRDALAVN